MDPARPLSEMDTQYLGSTGEGTLRYMYLYVYIRVYRMRCNKEGGEKKKEERQTGDAIFTIRIRPPFPYYCVF